MFRFFRRARKAPATVQDAQPSPSQRTLAGGRRRAAEVPYLLPADFEETNRLDMQHFMLHVAFRGDVMAPIQQPLAILDVGCGTGRWAREMALHHQQANVIGLDVVEPSADVIARQLRSLGSIPDNYAFVQGNVLKGLPFDAGRFDYTHMRFLALAIPQNQWMGVVAEMDRVTRIGGWIELVEFNTPRGGGPAFRRVEQLWDQLANTFQLDSLNADHVGARLRDLGYRHLGEKRVVVNTADRSDRAGKMAAVDLDAGIESSAPALYKLGLTTPEELAQLREAARAEYARPEYNVRWEFCAAYGQKPQG